MACGLSLALALAPVSSAASPADDVLRVLQEAKKDQRRSPAEVLRRLEPIGPAKVAALRLTLLNDDAYVRSRAAGVLGLVGDSCTGLMTRLLEDDSAEVRSYAAGALVRMGSASLEPLAVLVERRPPTSEVFLLALDTIGKIGGAGGAARACATLERYRSGGFAHEPVWAALRAMGPVAVVPVARLVRYRDLQAGARLTLLSYDQAALAAQLTATLADPALSARERLDLAAEAERLLGTERMRGALVPVLERIQVGAGVSEDLRREAAAMLRQMQASPRKALTAREVTAAEAARVSKEQNEDAERQRRKAKELEAARAADAAEDRRSKTTFSNETRRTVPRPVSEPYVLRQAEPDWKPLPKDERPAARQANVGPDDSQSRRTVPAPMYPPSPIFRP